MLILNVVSPTFVGDCGSRNEIRLIFPQLCDLLESPIDRSLTSPLPPTSFSASSVDPSSVAWPFVTGFFSSVGVGTGLLPFANAIE